MMDFHLLKLGIVNWDHKEMAGMGSEVPEVEQAWVLPSREKDDSKS
jgi:hypothetical protein